MSGFDEGSDVSMGHKRRNESYFLGSRFVRISTTTRELRSSESVAMPKRHEKKLRLARTNIDTRIWSVIGCKRANYARWANHLL